MRIHVPGLDITLDSAADLSTHQFKFVVGAALSGTSQQARTNVAGAAGRTLGVLQNKPNAANLGAVVRVAGTTKLVVNGTTPIAVGDSLIADTTGRGVKGTTAGAVGAIALEASIAADDIIHALIVHY